MRRLGLLFVLLLGVALAAAAQSTPAKPAQPPARAQVLVLGAYHMANPGRDIFKMSADDVLAPRRQAEIAEAFEVLKKFEPTKIAVEAEVSDQSLPKRYADYLAGKHALSRSEVEQIGFRLAKELGLKAVYPVDVEGEFPFQRVADYAKVSGSTRSWRRSGRRLAPR
jgi:hypothetical protein